MADLVDKVPPHNLEAEQSVLGAMLLEKEAILKAVEVVRTFDFYREAHGLIFSAIVELTERGEPVDIITVTEELRQKGVLQETGGAAYITALANLVPTAANVEYHARIVQEKAILRSLIQAGTRIAALGYQGGHDVTEVVDQAEKLVYGIAERRIIPSYVPLKEVLVGAFEMIERLYTKRVGVIGVPTGFKELDELTSGLQPSDLIVIAARPAMGKTALSLNIARNAAALADIPVCIFSLETSREQLALRLLAAEARVDGKRLRAGLLRDAEWPDLSRALGLLSRMAIYVDDTPGISVIELRARARRLKSEKGLGLVIVDYLQMIRSTTRRENRQQEVSEISRALKELARELKVPVVALSQLSRAVEARQDRRPLLSDLRESGAIEQDADVVAFIYREGYYKRGPGARGVDDRNEAEIIVAKQRHGPVGVVKLAFKEEYGLFAPLERYREPERLPVRGQQEVGEPPLD